MFHAYYNLNGKPYEISRKESSNDPVLFNEKRKIGENDDHICELIRKDLLDDFILYVNKFNVCLTKKIETPFYETNPFLLKGKNHKIIEYAAFFGSIRIFKYLLLKKNIELEPSLWLYAIHGNNYELIHLLEEKNVELNDKIYKRVVKESIKCHYHDITNYIITNYGGKIDLNLTKKCIKYYNYGVISDNIDDLKELFFDLCKYDYFHIVDILVKNMDIDINMKKK